jgi:molybdopterin-guanine dinucleotide biosynthesis protein A
VPAFVQQMLAFADGYDIAVIEVEGFPHPLSAVYNRATLPQVEELLAGNRLRPAFLFDAVKTRRVRPEEMTADPELHTLQNLNTPEDYAKALARLRET